VYIQGWRYFDSLNPELYKSKDSTPEISVVVFDPPFFSVVVEQMKNAVQQISMLHNISRKSQNDCLISKARCKKEVFGQFGLKKTKPMLGYTLVHQDREMDQLYNVQQC
jgi:hypothetical protein